jgi:predicted CXXCH cytochrome family protein
MARLVWIGPCFVAALSAACGAPSPPPRSGSGTASDVVSSNVARDDYAGSDACAPCHHEIYDRWKASPMRNMTRHAGGGVIRAPFDGARVPFKGDLVTMEEHAGNKFMRVVTARAGAKLFRVTKVIGGRYREDFVGREVAGTEPDALPLGDPRDESVLPLSYMLFDKTWRYKGYSVMVTDRPRIERGAVWRKTCILCHNTAPLLTTIYDDLLGAGAKTYQGSISDSLLPSDRRLGFEVIDEARLAGALEREIELVSGREARGSSARERLAEAISVTQKQLEEKHLVEVGIGCEACHGGAKEHARDPKKRPTYEPVSAFLRTKAALGGKEHRAEAINRTCARCHTVLFSRYPYTWEGGLRSQNPGGSSINSGEARDFLLGGCAKKMTCTTCHDPHTEDAREKLDELGTVKGNRVCVGCHERYAGDEALRAHTHHAPSGEGSACLGCHMPRKNTGLGYALTRYHRIGSPTDRARVELDRPLECALCHHDKSVASLVGAMETWWSKRYDRARLVALYGPDLGVNALAATLAAGKPHEQIAAAGVAGARWKGGAAAAALAPLLYADYPLTRRYARAAMEAAVGRPISIDLDAPVEVIAREAARIVEAAIAPGGRGPGPSTPPRD